MPLGGKNTSMRAFYSFQVSATNELIAHQIEHEKRTFLSAGRLNIV